MIFQIKQVFFASIPPYILSKKNRNGRIVSHRRGHRRLRMMPDTCESALTMLRKNIRYNITTFFYIYILYTVCICPQVGDSTLALIPAYFTGYMVAVLSVMACLNTIIVCQTLSKDSQEECDEATWCSNIAMQNFKLHEFLCIVYMEQFIIENGIIYEFSFFKANTSIAGNLHCTSHVSCWRIFQRYTIGILCPYIQILIHCKQNHIATNRSFSSIYGRFVFAKRFRAVVVVAMVLFSQVIHIYKRLMCISRMCGGGCVISNHSINAPNNGTKECKAHTPLYIHYHQKRVCWLIAPRSSE